MANSSKFLNNNESASALETFLQRFLYISLLFVDAAGGEFIKWTGDGFLAWFETPLHRNVGTMTGNVFSAAWYLSFLVNVTQLNVESKVKFMIRHAVTFEHDALLVELAHSNKRNSADVLGRSVVLAFRLSSIACNFPSIVSQRELVTSLQDQRFIRFRKINFSKEERLKYFKGESWGTRDIFVSGEHKSRKRSTKSLVKQIKSTIAQAEGEISHDTDLLDFQRKLLKEIAAGPSWCKEVYESLVNFVEVRFLGTLKNIVPILESRQNESPKPTSV